MSPKASWILQDQIVPRLRSAIPSNVNRIGSEDCEELIQDSVCIAAKLLDNAENANKSVTPGNIVYYTILHMKSGRRSYGFSTVDVLGTGTQLNGRSTTTSFDEVVEVGEGEEFTVNDVLSIDAEDPSIEAAQRLDWASFNQSLSDMERLLIRCLIEGLGIREAAQIAKVHYCTMRSYRRKLAEKIIEFMGSDILKDIAQTPRWKIGPDCERAMLACRADRRG